jgi:chlorite dismutase
VVEQHREKIAIDLYLLRGLSDQADLMFRVHAAELRDTQQFLMDLQNSAFGKYLKGAGLMHGLTKKANYVPGFPDQLKADLKVVSEPGSKPYAIVIPVTKSADWWALDQEKRAAMMREHTEATLPYLTTVKRKLYHSSGLDDLDFITYFETSKLEDFHSLILSLEKVKEFQYTLRSGHPTLIGTAKSVDELIEALAQ